MAELFISSLHSRGSEPIFFDVAVLDYQELTPEISVQPVDRIRI